MQWSWIAECRAEVVGHLILGREIELLEKLWGDGEAASGSNVPKSRLIVDSIIHMIFSALSDNLIVFKVRHNENPGKEGKARMYRYRYTREESEGGESEKDGETERKNIVVNRMRWGDCNSFVFLETEGLRKCHSSDPALPS